MPLYYPNKEIQSAHFGASKKQISLQTGAFYYKDQNNKQQCVTFSSISECLSHDAAAAWALLQPIFILMKKCVPQVEIINFQSDGPSTQYKNKTNFYLFNYFCPKFNIKYSTWNFTGAGHGKSVAGGVGGSLKSLCDRAVSFGKDITCAEDMVNVVENSEEIDKIVPNNLTVVRQSTLVHQVFWTSRKEYK